MFRENDRRSTFKKTIDNQDGRRRREETTRQIRKAKKDEQLQKRRMGTPAEITPNNSMDSPSSAAGPSKKLYNVADIPNLSATVKSPDSTEQQLEEAVRGFRRILSVEKNPPVQPVLQSGVLPVMIECLTKNPQASNLIFEAAWALTNIASTSETAAVVEAGAIAPAIQCLYHEVAEVREQAAWLIGNIAGDNTRFRDLLLQSAVLKPLLMNIENPGSASLLNNVTWSLSNLCRGKPAPAFELVAPAIPYLTGLLGKDVPIETKVDAAWALSYLSDGPNERIEVIMSTGVVSTLMGFLKDKSTQLLTPTLRCIGNFVTGSDEQTQAVINAGILDYLPDLLESGRKAIRKESCWLASNITAGTQDQIAMLVRRTELSRSLINNASNSAWDVRKEAIWALSNICTVGSDVQVMGLVQAEGLRPIVDILGFMNADSTVLMAALDAVDTVLAVGVRHDMDYVPLIDEYNGIEFIEQLQEHPTNAVYEKTVHILETYFGADDEEDENMAPVVTDSGTFGFGMASPKQLFPQGHAGHVPQAAAVPLQFSFGNAAH